MIDDPKKPEDMPEEDFADDSFDEGFEEYDEYYDEQEGITDEDFQEDPAAFQDDEFAEEQFSEEWDDDGFHDEFEGEEADPSLYDDKNKKTLSSNTIIIIAAVIVGFGVLVWQVTTKGAAVQQVERFVSAIGMTGLTDNPVFNKGEDQDQSQEKTAQNESAKGFLNDPRLLSKDQEQGKSSQVSVVDDAPPMPAPISPVEEGRTDLTPMPSSTSQQPDRNLTNTVTSNPQRNEGAETDIPEYAPPRGPQEQNETVSAPQEIEDRPSQSVARNENSEAAEDILRAAIAKRQQAAARDSGAGTSPEPQEVDAPPLEEAQGMPSEEQPETTAAQMESPSGQDAERNVSEVITATDQMQNTEDLEGRDDDSPQAADSSNADGGNLPNAGPELVAVMEQVQTVSRQLEQVVEKIEDLDMKVTQVKEEANLRISQLGEEIERVEKTAPAQRTSSSPSQTSSDTSNTSSRNESAASSSVSGNKAPSAQTGKTVVPESKPPRPSPAPQRTAASPVEWELRAAQPGKAWVSQSGRQDIRSIEVGDSLPGLGRITAVNYAAGRWIVQGTRGRLVQ